MNFAVRNIVFPEPGEYRLQLLSGLTPLMERRIVVLKIGDDGQEAKENGHEE